MRWAGLLTAGLLAAGPAAAQAPAADPPPPASLAAQDVAAWSEQHLDAKGWRVLAISPHGLFLASPDGVTLREDKLAEADLRHEMFGPVEMGGATMRSDLEHWWVDCAAKRHALMRISVYRGNNLQGEFASRGTETPQWRESGPDDEAAQAIAAVCEAVASAKRTPKPAGHP